MRKHKKKPKHSHMSRNLGNMKMLTVIITSNFRSTFFHREELLRKICIHLLDARERCRHERKHISTSCVTSSDTHTRSHKFLNGFLFCCSLLSWMQKVFSLTLPLYALHIKHKKVRKKNLRGKKFLVVVKFFMAPWVSQACVVPLETDVKPKSFRSLVFHKANSKWRHEWQ